MAAVATRYAVRSVGRNMRRTALSVVGVAIGCVLALFMESLNRGSDELFVRVGATAGIGHVRVVPQGWKARRDSRLRLAGRNTDLAAIRSLPGVAVVTTRTRAEALLALGTHVVPVELVGVEPEVEPSTFRYVQRMQKGRYLRSSETGGLVIGQAIADRLTADVDDEIVVSTVGTRGDIQSGLFRIVGIASTGTEDGDTAICQVARDDLERLTGLEGSGEISIVLKDYRDIDAFRAALVPKLAPGDEVVTLADLAPEMHGHFEQHRVSGRVMSAIILLIVLLGVASAQLAAVLERRREFAVLSALGMTGGRMVRLVVEEALIVGVVGAVAALALGLPLVWHYARVGLDFTSVLGSTYSFGGVLIDAVIYLDMGWWIAPYVASVAIGATVIASIYPAWYASRTDPAVALRVAQ